MGDKTLDYICLISREPVPEMITDVTDKDGKLQYRYIKKSLLQNELLKIYDGYTRWEMLRETVTAKGMYGVGRFEYKHPVSGEWLSVTGTASLPQDKKMRLGFPSLESHCFLNAVKKIGVWFGQTLNVVEEDKMPDEAEPEPELTQEEKNISLSEQLAFCKTADELKSYRIVVYSRGIPAEIQALYEQRLREFKK